MCRILVLFLHLFLLTSDYIEDVRAGCSRIPQGASGERSAVDDNFKILIDGNPETYIPDHQYNGKETQSLFNRAYSRALLYFFQCPFPAPSI